MTLGFNALAIRKKTEIARKLVGNGALSYKQLVF